MTKRALLIGINYPGSNSELRGCVNDVQAMYNTITERFGFEHDNITMLIDTDDNYTLPNGKNIRDALYNLVNSAESGDVLLVHYSGHGTRVPAETGDDDDTGFDECIVPCDMNLITDDDIREFVDMVPEDATITIIADSCHSGGLIDDSKEQIGESTVPEGEEPLPIEEDAESKDIQLVERSLPMEILVENLKQQSGYDDIDVGKLRPTFYNMFGEDSSTKVKKFMKAFATRAENGEEEGPMVEYMRQKMAEDENYARALADLEVAESREVYAGLTKAGFPDSGILISGCQSNQVSADAQPGDREPFGALSNAIQRVINDTNGDVTYHDLVIKTREVLAAGGYQQRPGLWCSNDKTSVQFLG